MISRAFLFARSCGRPLPGLLTLALLAGCSLIETPTVMRGHKVENELLKELVPGTSSRADVTALLGSPTARATFDDDVWIYAASVTREQIARYPAIQTQDVTVISFTPAGTLKEIKRLSKDDAVPVDVVTRATPSPGSEMTLLQEFLANVGRLAPSAAGAAKRGGGGGI